MRTSLLFLLSLCLLFCSCDNSARREEQKAAIPSLTDSAAVAKHNQLLKKFDPPSQIFKVSSSKPSVVSGKAGTKLFVEPQDLETVTGGPMGKNIEVELKEIVDQNGLFHANAQTVSNGRPLISGGAYFINLSSNNNALKLKEGKKLYVQFPQRSEKEMQLFYGARNQWGQMNWEIAGDTLIAPVVKAPIAGPASDTSRTAHLSEIDQIIDYLDSGENTTPVQKAKYQRLVKNYQLSVKTYEKIGLNQFGWINCDRFLDESNLTNVYVSFNEKDSIYAANIFFLFKKINSVVQPYMDSAGEYKVQNMPVGYSVKLIAYCIKNEKVYGCQLDTTISDQMKLHLNLKEMGESELTKLLK